MPERAESSFVSRLRFRISISLDGFVAGPHQSATDPRGVGGTRSDSPGAGERLFDRMADLRGLELVRTVAAPEVVHLRLVRG